MRVEEETRGWYEQYYAHMGMQRNDLLRNPEVLFQTLAADRATINALHDTGLDPVSSTLLDVGCGGGESLWNFLRLGFQPENCCGVDILQERIVMAKAKHPNSRFFYGDASDMTSLFESNSFDIVSASTMFVQITDDLLAARIAKEMIRVVKSGGFILISDWRYNKPCSREYAGVTKPRLMNLFAVDHQTTIHSTHKGMLAPPVGRRLSRYLPSTYFLVSALLPFLVAQTVTVLRKL